MDSHFNPSKSTTNQSKDSGQNDLRFTPIAESDFAEWKRLFQAYIEFYKSSLPDDQYTHTFSRLTDPNGDLHGLLARDGTAVIGIAHFFTIQTPWSERKIMLLNDLFVDPSARGKGCGKRMIEHVAQRAREEDCLRLQWVTQHWNPARKLYDEMATSDFVDYRMKF